MNLPLNLFLIMFFIGAAGIFSGLEIGGYLLNRIRLRCRLRQKDSAAARLQHVLSNAHLFIFTVLIGHNIAVYLVSRSVTQLYLQAGISSEHHGRLLGLIPWNAETAATLTLMIPLFLFAEVIPKNLFRRHADTLMYRYSVFLLFAWKFLRPFTSLLNLVFNRLTGNHEQSETFSSFSLSLQGLREYFSEGSSHSALSEYQHGMMDHLVSMHRMSVRDVLQPVSGKLVLPDTATVQQALDLMCVHHLEQLFVRRGSVHQLTGVLNLFDLMDPALNAEDPIRPHVRKVSRLSARLSLSSAFRRLRQKKESVAFITDHRSSRVIGVLHLHDIARYIVSGA